MKVILLKSVPKVGAKDIIVEVASGYAENALFPRKLAIPATDVNIAALNRRKQNIVAEQEIQHALLDKAIVAANDLSFAMPVRANKEGVLFSKVHEKDITDYLMKTHRIAVDPAYLTIVNGPIKNVGPYEINVVDGVYRSVLHVSIVAL